VPGSLVESGSEYEHDILLMKLRGGP
jgi:hypothetical protein